MIAFLAVSLLPQATPARYELEAGESLTPVELNHGDALRFKLRDGRVRTIILRDSRAEILERPKKLPGLVYAFSADLLIDGHPLTLQRYVCTQESFYEPWVVNGLRIWFDMALDTFRKIPERYPGTGHRRARPHKDARFAIHDASLPLCPQEMRPWYPNERLRLSIGDCYNGEDCWMGPYLGQACHRGLDLNHRKGDPLWAPIDFDDQWLFHSVARGQDNNRWRGIRRWPNGDVWALQTHHLIQLRVPEHTPLKAGTHYADAAGVRVGSHHHSHFEFMIARPPDGRVPDFDSGETLKTMIYEEIADPRPRQPVLFHLDPWILFWQIFEAERGRKKLIRASFAPPGPVRSGEPIVFSGEASRPGKEGGPLRWTWAFGDGTGAQGHRPTHVFTRPGIYPVTLVVEDDKERATCTRHLTVDGDPVTPPALVLEAADEPSFRLRPVGAADVYGDPVQTVPFTLEFTARPGPPNPRSRTVRVRNGGGGALAAPSCRVTFQGRAGWLTTLPAEGGREIRILADGKDLAPGRHEAVVSIDIPGALNSPQEFRVRLQVRADPPPARITIRDGDEGYFCTPWFWVGHRLMGGPPFYRTNGARPVPGEFIRFTPDLEAGRYHVHLNLGPGAGRFDVRVRHRGGEDVVRMGPDRPRLVGTFDFDEGTDGFVEVRTENSEGLVAVESVTFERVGTGEGPR